MLARSFRALCLPAALAAFAALALSAAGCPSDDETEEPVQLLVRTASGTPLDVTGTAWRQGYPGEPAAGMSRRTTFAFGSGTFTMTTEVFTASDGCTGPTDPAQGETASAQAAAQGDRTVGWDDLAPEGLPVTVTATAVLLSGVTPASVLPDPFKTLFFVNDSVTPGELHMGGKAGVAPDGYPTTLESWGRPRVSP